jgi:hypothetical protein
MGFLNHSTNNIIVDATLTEKGRELLSTGTNITISNFSFGDDEVDYSIITKYGMLTGKEKIEKNTPILEASTNQSLSLKYPLEPINAFNENNLPSYVPNITLDDINHITLTFGDERFNNTEITLRTSLTDVDTSFVLTDSLVDTQFRVFYDKTFIKISETTQESTKRSNVVYSDITLEAITDLFHGQRRASNIQIRTSSNLTSTNFSKYSIDDTIRTQLYVVGNNSSSNKVIPVVINLQ